MKVLWISHLLPYPPKGGVLQRSYHLLREASSRHEVYFAALVQPTMQTTKEEKLEAVRHLSQFCEQVQSFRMPAGQSGMKWWLLVAASFFRSTPYNVDWMHSGDMHAYLAELSARKSFDLVHVDTVGLAPYARHFSATPKVLNHHNIESVTMRQRAEQESRLLHRIYFRREAAKLRRYEHKMCRQATLNIVVSEEEIRRFREVVDSPPVAVVENGADIEYFDPASPAGLNNRGLIFVGGLSFYPNREAMEFFIKDVWPRLAESRLQQSLKVIGRDPPPELRSEVESGAVTFTGFVEDIRPHMEDAAIYVCPIRSGGGTRLKVIDALAMAKPLVATEFAVNGLGLEEGKHYLKAESAEDYVRQITRLEQDRALRRRLAREGRRLVEEEYAWSVIGEHLEAAYQRAIGARKDYR